MHADWLKRVRTSNPRIKDRRPTREVGYNEMSESRKKLETCGRNESTSTRLLFNRVGQLVHHEDESTVCSFSADQVLS